MSHEDERSAIVTSLSELAQRVTRTGQQKSEQERRDAERRYRLLVGAGARGGTTKADEKPLREVMEVLNLEPRDVAADVDAVQEVGRLEERLAELAVARVQGGDA